MAPEKLKTFEKDVLPGMSYLAAATLIHWKEIPEDTRKAIIHTAEFGSIVGLPPTTGLHEQLSRLVKYSE